MDELIATLKFIIETSEAAFAAVDDVHDEAIHLAAIDPDLSFAIASLCGNYEQFESVRSNMRHFMMNILGNLLADAFYANVVIEEHNTAEPVPVGPVVADEHNTVAPEEMVEHNTAAPEETAEHNQDLPDLDPNKRA